MDVDDTQLYKQLDRILIEEVRYFHQLMFRYYPNEKLIDAYCRVHSDMDLLQNFNNRQLETLSIILSNQLDATSIEPWLRSKKIRHPLSTKLMLISYLSECDATHLSLFRALPDGHNALIKMPCLILISGFRLILGYFQKVRYGLV